MYMYVQKKFYMYQVVLGNISACQQTEKSKNQKVSTNPHLFDFCQSDGAVYEKQASPPPPNTEAPIGFELYPFFGANRGQGRN